MSKAKIGIIGTGNMGRAFGLAWARAGYPVSFGSRNASKAEATARQVSGAKYGSFASAAAFGDVIFYTVREPLPSALLGPGALDGKIVIDCNNSAIWGFDLPDPKGRPGLHFPPTSPSLAEGLAADVPRARVAKAFNTLPSVLLDLPETTLRAAKISVFVCSDEAEARRQTAELAAAIGFVPIDSGGLEHAGAIESVADVIRYQILANKQPMRSAISYQPVEAP